MSIPDYLNSSCGESCLVPSQNLGYKRAINSRKDGRHEQMMLTHISMLDRMPTSVKSHVGFCVSLLNVKRVFNLSMLTIVTLIHFVSSGGSSMLEVRYLQGAD